MVFIILPSLLYLCVDVVIRIDILVLHLRTQAVGARPRTQAMGTVVPQSRGGLGQLGFDLLDR